MLEEGASLLGIEVDVGVGVADVIFRGRDGRVIVVEIKSHGDDLAVGQVSRIADGYAAKERVEAKEIRRVIVCLTHNRNLVEACRGADIELYGVCLSRLQSLTRWNSLD